MIPVQTDRSNPKGIPLGLALFAAMGLVLLWLQLFALPPALADPDTYYVSTSGDDANPCNDPALPCRTVGAAIAKAAPGDEIFVAEGQYTDPAGTVAVITKSLILQGGWNASFTVRDPANNTTTLDAQRHGPVIVMRGDISAPPITATIDGFVITGGNGTGVAGCTAIDAVGCGGGIFGIRVRPTIINNTVTDNIAAIGGVGYGGGIYLEGDLAGGVINNSHIYSNVAAISAGTTITGFGGGICLHNVTAEVQDNTIENNRAAIGNGYGGGIYLHRNGSHVSDNIIQNNIASEVTSSGDLGLGGGMHIWECGSPYSDVPLIEANEFYGNIASEGGQGAGAAISLVHTEATIDNNIMSNNISANNSTQQGDGGGVFGTEGTEWTLSNNTVTNNIASTGGRGFGGGFQLEDAEVTVEGNLIEGNTATQASQTVLARGGGINLLRCTGVVRNNIVQDNAVASNANASGYGGGISVNLLPVTIEGNTILRNSATRWGGGIRIYEAEGVTVVNNFIGDNAADVEGGGVHVNGTEENHASATLIHNTLVDNDQGDAGEGIYVNGQAVVTAINNIISDHETAIHNAGTPPVTTVSADHTLFHRNTTSTSGSVDNTNALYGTPYFVNPGEGDFHILINSDAINAGVEAGVTTDIDGDTRPQGAQVDIGADEYLILVDVELTPDRTDSGLPGSDVAYYHTLTNLGTFQDTFDLSYTSNQGWAVSLNPSGPVTLDAGSSRTIIATVSIPEGVVAGTADITTVTATSQSDDQVSDSAQDTTTVEADYAAPELTPDRADTADPDEAVVFEHTLTNNSNAAETFTLSAVSDHGWTTVTSADPTVPPFGSTTVQVTVYVPDDALADTIDTTTLTATGSGGSDTVEDTITVNTFLAYPTLVPNRASAANPGESVVFTHTLTNNSNIAETFILGASSAHGWAVTLPPDPTIPPFSAIIMQVVVDVPDNALAGTTDATFVTATGGRGTEDATDTITVLAQSAVSLSPDQTTHAFPGAVVTFTHILTNDGNLTDIFDLHLDGAGWSATVAPTPTIQLSPWETHPVTITVEVPADALSDTVNTVLFTATSQSAPTISDTTANRTTVSADYAAPSFSPGAQVATGDPKETVVFTQTLANRSNATETFTLEAVSALGWPTDLPSTTTLPPFGTAPVTMSVTVPAGAVAGTVCTTTLTATGQGGSATAQNILWTGVVIDLQLSSGQTHLVGPSTIAVLTHTLTNAGSIPDTYNITVQSNGAWSLAYNPVTVTLSPYQSVTPVITLTVPQALSGTQKTLTITAASQSVVGLSETIQDTVIVKHIPAVTLGPDQFANTRPGEHLTFTHRLTNAGNLTDTFNLTATSAWTITVTPEQTTLAPWQGQDVILTIQVPQQISEPTVHTVVITATSVLQPAVYDTAQNSIGVLTLVGPLEEIYLPLIVRNGLGATRQSPLIPARRPLLAAGRKPR